MIHLNVEKIREARGVTKTHLAKKLGLSLQGYRHITSGGARLDVERLKIISEVLNVSPEIFFNTELTDFVIKEFESKTSA
jgi:transcriptional regulator with XRE-family HTH domain